MDTVTAIITAITDIDWNEEVPQTSNVPRTLVLSGQIRPSGRLALQITPKAAGELLSILQDAKAAGLLG